MGLLASLQFFHEAVTKLVCSGIFQNVAQSRRLSSVNHQKEEVNHTMIFVSLTRLRIRSPRFLPSFFVYMLRSVRQVKKAQGFQQGALLVDRNRTFWTLTAWNSEETMRGYRNTGAHKSVMPHLLNWCDEASVAHWTQPEPSLPSWEEADRRMRETGRASKVLNPTPCHANLTYDPPRITSSSTIKPA